MCVFPAILSSALSGPDESSIISTATSWAGQILSWVFIFVWFWLKFCLFFPVRLFAGVFQILGILFYLFLFIYLICRLASFNYKEHFGVSDESVWVLENYKGNSGDY